MERVNSISSTPVLRWKWAEKHALANRGFFKEKNRVLPIIEPIPANFEGIDPHIAFEQIAHELFTYWGQEKVFIDVQNLKNYDFLGLHPFSFFVTRADALGLHIVPVVGIDASIRGEGFQRLAFEVGTKNHTGVCLRISADTVLGKSFISSLNGFLNSYGLPPTKIDLVTDRGFIDDNSPGIDSFYTRLPYLDQWRSVTILGGNFPPNLMDYKPGAWELKRLGWTSWKAYVTKNTGVIASLPNFGDFGIQHYKYIDPGKNSNPSASVRYASDDYWLILRGRSIKKYGGQQFIAHAQLLCERSEFSGRSFSIGDTYAYDKSKQMSLPLGKRLPGGLKEWLFAATNHHLDKTVNQLISLPITVAIPTKRTAGQK